MTHILRHRLYKHAQGQTLTQSVNKVTPAVVKPTVGTPAADAHPEFTTGSAERSEKASIGLPSSFSPA